VGTVGNCAFPLGRWFQWELRSRCQKSKGTEFPCVPAETKPWWRSFYHVRNATIGFRDPQNMGRHKNCAFALPNTQDKSMFQWQPSWNPRWRLFYHVMTSTIRMLDPKNTGRDTEIVPLSYLEPEIMLKTCSEWRPFWNPRWRPTNANPSLANYLSLARNWLAAMLKSKMASIAQ